MKRSDIKNRPLADKTVAALEPESKAYRERDSHGLYLYVRPDGRKSWEPRYRKPDGKYSWLGLGAYPAVRSKEARQKAQEARDLIEQGITLRQHQKQQELQAQAAQTETVKALLDEWYAMKAKTLAPGTLQKLWLSLEKHVTPAMGQRPITDIRPACMLAFFRQLEALGIHETSAKIRRSLAEAFDMAAFAGRLQSNPIRGVERFVESSTYSNYAHVSYAEFPELIRAIDQYPRSPQVRTAMLLLALNVCRPGELRNAQCHEFDLDNALWTIPAERMKKRRPHIIPLAPLSVALVREQMDRVGGHGYLFPNRNDRHSEARFSPIDTYDNPPLIRDRVGWWKTINGRRLYLFTPGGLKEATRGFDFKRALKALTEGGLLRTGGVKSSVVTRTPEEHKRLYHVQLLQEAA